MLYLKEIEKNVFKLSGIIMYWHTDIEFIKLVGKKYTRQYLKEATADFDDEINFPLNMEYKFSFLPLLDETTVLYNSKICNILDDIYCIEFMNGKKIDTLNSSVFDVKFRYALFLAKDFDVYTSKEQYGHKIQPYKNKISIMVFQWGWNNYMYIDMPIKDIINIDYHNACEHIREQINTYREKFEYFSLIPKEYYERKLSDIENTKTMKNILDHNINMESVFRWRKFLNEEEKQEIKTNYLSKRI
jgi:hypothetical protein